MKSSVPLFVVVFPFVMLSALMLWMALRRDSEWYLRLFGAVLAIVSAVDAAVLLLFA